MWDVSVGKQLLQLGRYSAFSFRVKRFKNHPEDEDPMPENTLPRNQRHITDNWELNVTAHCAVESEASSQSISPKLRHCCWFTYFWTLVCLVPCGSDRHTFLAGSPCTALQSCWKCPPHPCDGAWQMQLSPSSVLTASSVEPARKYRITGAAFCRTRTVFRPTTTPFKAVRTAFQCLGLT